MLKSAKLTLGSLICALFGLSQMSLGSVIWVPAKQQNLRFANGAEPKELNPKVADGIPEAQIISQLYEGLVRFNPFTKEFEPAQAESWEISPDLRTFKFKLKQGLRWSNGDPVLAEDFVYGIENLLSPKTASRMSYYAYMIKGAKDYSMGKLKDASLLGVRAIDARQLEFKLEYPSAIFIQSLSMYPFTPLHKATAAKMSAQDWSRAAQIVSNGPFKLKSWELNKKIVLEKNDLYWQRDIVALNEVSFLPGEDPSSMEKAFLLDELDIGMQPPSMKQAVHYKASLDAKAYHPFKVNPILGKMAFAIKLDHPILKDRRVREALSLTVDRSLIVERILGTGQKPSHTMTPPVFKDYKTQALLNTKVRPEDTKRAQSLLAEAGYPGAKNIPKLRILYPSHESNRRLISALQQMWKKQLGIELELIGEEWKVFQSTRNRGEFDLCFHASTASVNDPYELLESFSSESDQNIAGYKNPKFDELLRMTQGIADRTRRLSQLAQAEEMLIRDFPEIFLYDYSDKRLVAERVKMRDEKGEILPWSVDPTGRIHFAYIMLMEKSSL